MHGCWLTRALLTFDVLAVVCAALAQGPEVDTRGALGRPAGVDHLEGLEGRDQYLLLPREEGVALDGGPNAGPDVKQGAFPKCLGHTPLQGCRGKAPQPDGGPRPRRPEAQALNPSEHLVALGWTLAAAQQLQGFGQQEVECLEGEVLEVQLQDSRAYVKTGKYMLPTIPLFLSCFKWYVIVLVIQRVNMASTCVR